MASIDFDPTLRAVPVGLDGLGAHEAAQRLRADGPNVLPEARRRPAAFDLAARLLEPLNLILVVAGVLTIAALDEVLQGATIIGVALLNAVVGGVLERRADDASRQLARLVSASARVRRDGTVLMVPVADVVRGDVVLLAAGDRVPADLSLADATELQLDESMLTGESLPVSRGAGDPVFSGTQVTAGTGAGRVVATGSATQLGAIAGMLDAKPEPTPLQRRLTRLTGRLGVLAVGIGAAAGVSSYVRTAGAAHRVGEAVLVAVALAIAAVPEGLPTAITSALAFSGLRLARRGAIVRSLTALEGLGSATVLCTDKTGTLTTGTLDVLAVEAAVDDRSMWAAIRRCNDAEATGDAVDVALLRAADRTAATPDRSEAGSRLLIRPFDARTRAMTTVHATPTGAVVTMKGAPEQVWARCDADEHRVTLAALRDRADAHSSAGARVLAFAAASAGEGASIEDLADLADRAPLAPVGIVAFGDPLRPSAAPAVAEARRHGLRVVMVTGDHPATARAIAAAAGMDTEPCVTGSDLDALDGDVRRDALANAAVVARVDPAVKLELIDALRAAGHVVAMTGDGVNDAPALQRADIGIAVGGSDATDVARHAAALVLGDGELSTVVRALENGKQIHRNLRATVAYMLTGNLSEILVILGALIVFPELATPLLPAQLLWINFVTDTVPAIALGIDSRPLSPSARASDELLTMRSWLTMARRALLLAATVVGSALGSGSPERTRAQLVASLVCVHLVLAYVARADRFAFEAGWWRNRVLLVSTLVAIVVQIAIFQLTATRRLLEVAALPSLPLLRIAGAVAVFVTVDALGGRVRGVVRRRRRTVA